MSLDSYLDALRESSTLPDALSAQVTSADSLSPQVLEQDEDVHRRVEGTVREIEQFAADAPLNTLAERSVLTLAGLANVRLGARYLIAASAAEQSGGISAMALGGEGVANVMVDSDTENIIGAIRRAASYSPAANTGTTATPDLNTLKNEFQALVDAILNTGGTAIKELAGAVSWGVVAGGIGGAIADAAKRSQLFAAASTTFGWLKDRALKIIEAGFKALERAVGAGALGTFLKTARQKLDDWVKGNAAADLLSQLMNTSTIAPDCVALVKAAGASPTQQAAALNAAEAVAKHAEGLGDVSHKVAKVIGWFPAAVWSSPAGPYLAAGFVVATAATVWQVQDHLDSTTPFAAPNLTEGLISAVRKAV
jgi:hypothetical protein